MSDTGRTLTVGVLGAAGTIGPAIVRDLAESAEVERMVLCDLDVEGAERIAALHGGGRAEAVPADIALAATLADCDVLVNSASYRVNLEAMEACLKADCHYLDLGGLYWMTGRQLALSDRFAEAGLLAVLGIGSSPGKTNLMAALAVRELGGRVDAIHVSAAGRDLDPPASESFPYALRTLLDEVTMSPIAVRDHEPVELAPLTPGGTVDFGDPIGEAETIQTVHSELRTFPQSFGCRDASFRFALPAALLGRLRTLAGASPEDIAAAAAQADRPSPRTVAVHQVEAASGERAVRVRAVTWPSVEWGLGGGIVSTAAPAAATVRLIARDRVEARGALPPERCIEPDELLSELESRCTTLTVEAIEGEML
jgi:lysine 6-dehydrogenase